MRDAKATLSTLWLFAVLNFVYCDVLTLYDHVFIKQSSTIQYTQAFLLGAAILVEIPMLMVLLSRVLRYPLNRWANIIAGGLMTVVQGATLLGGTPTMYYVLFSILEIATTAVIVWQAWKWVDPAPETQVAVAGLAGPGPSS
jgi:hypothetical protein